MGVIMDGTSIHNWEELHELLARDLAFPAWYGGNLDALFDCLTDLREDTEIVLCHTEALEQHLGPYAACLRRVLRDAAEENPHIHLEVRTEGEA